MTKNVLHDKCCVQYFDNSSIIILTNASPLHVRLLVMTWYGACLDIKKKLVVLHSC